MADSNYPDIITRWNDPNKNHDAIIINLLIPKMI